MAIETCHFNFNQLPVAQGSWFVSNVENTGVVPHGAVERHSFTLQGVDQSSERFISDGSQNEHYVGYGMPVAAPGPGQVIRLVKGVSENQPGNPHQHNQLGNFVVLRHASSSTDPTDTKVLYSVLYHLRSIDDSIIPGQPVVQGQQLGEIGNSGRSLSPEMGYMLTRSPDHIDHITKPTLKPKGVGVLPHFLGVSVLRSQSVFDDPTLHSPRLGEVIRNASKPIVSRVR